MKLKIKSIIGMVVLLFLGSQPVKAQLFQTRSDIINKNGYSYNTGVTDDGIEYITYEKKMNSDASGDYTQMKVMYFTKLNNGTEVCYLLKIIDPSTETNNNVANCKSKLVEIDSMKWKDYSQGGIIYEIIVKDGLCIIAVFGDKK